MTMNEIQSMLTTLMRSIDKKTSLTVEPRPNPDRPGVVVHLVRDKRLGTLEISEVDLSASLADLRRRNQVRTALKRARDRMWEETGSFFSTKMERAAPEGMSFFRPMYSGRGRR